jgi:glycosyltransferase involved in cell wall biosynthesis
MVPMKGPDILAKAAVQILNDQNNTEFSFQFAGSKDSSNRDQQTIMEVKEILKDFDDGERVNYLGNPSYEEMPAHYHQADIVVLPLQVETENISVFEAWASGTPLITTQQVGKNGYMKHEENCLIVPNRDFQKLGDAILRLVHDVELRERLTNNGFEVVRKRFRWSHTAEKTVQFYEKVLNEINEDIR